MRLNEVKKSILNGISAKLKDHGFSFKKKDERFEREINGGLQIFDLLFFNSGEGILIEPVFRLKIHLIEDIYHRVTQKEEEYNDATQTLGNSLSQIIKYFDNGDEIGTTENIRYLVENDNDIEILKNVIPKRFEEYILPYFEKNNSIQQVDKLLNKNLRELSIHNRLYPTRACISIIAAKLLQRKDYDELVKIYREETEEADPESKKEFQDLVKLLSESKEFN